MFTSLWLAGFVPVDHGWVPLAPHGSTLFSGREWSRAVPGQEWPDLLMQHPEPNPEGAVLTTLALAGGTRDCPQGWTRDDLIAYISR
ncbi:hypothetical protein ACIGXM_14470 [Kitasatospora sp. NPDC052896]|uniref:hypothetical protein n=1 Tax=Kitasatospora sp. NPDC052896 TaxID=3364061 RepID=UPI0037C62771